MAQRRMISRNLGSSRKFHAVNAKCGKLGDFAQALFPLIVVNADDFGRLEGDAFTVKHKVFPVSPRSEEDFETALQAMSAVGLIRFYEAGGDRYLEIVNFDREQPGLHKRTKSDYPDPPDGFGKFPEIPGTSADPREIPGRTEPNLTEQNRHRTQPRLTPRCRGRLRSWSRSTKRKTRSCRRRWSSDRNAGTSVGIVSQGTRGSSSTNLRGQ